MKQSQEQTLGAIDGDGQHLGNSSPEDSPIDLRRVQVGAQTGTSATRRRQRSNGGKNYPEAAVCNLVEERMRLAAGVRAPATVVNYACDWKAFTAWCEWSGRSPLPASSDTVGLYLTSRIISGYKVSSAERHASAIAFYHRATGLESPCGSEIRRLLTGAQRLRLERPNQRAALELEESQADLREFKFSESAYRPRSRHVAVGLRYGTQKKQPGGIGYRRSRIH